MRREWKPGDVVTGLLDGNEIVGIVRGGGKRMFYADSVTTDQVDLKHVRNLRPLVVIDAENREQVARLAELIPHCHSPERCGQPRLCATKRLTAALREFADPKPPKPDEPTGLGAVVEDSLGDTWVRTHATGYPWHAALDPGDRNVTAVRKYEAIDAVKVLSEGVTR